MGITTPDRITDTPRHAPTARGRLFLACAPLVLATLSTWSAFHVWCCGRDLRNAGSALQNGYTGQW